MGRRIKFKCWNCEKTYTLLRSIDNEKQTKFLVECPYCNEEAQVEFEENASAIDNIFKSAKPSSQSSIQAVDLSVALETKPIPGGE